MKDYSLIDFKKYNQQAIECYYTTEDNYVCHI